MNYSLYKNDDIYYLIINKAINYNIAVDITTFSNILISNEVLSKFNLIDFNEENLKEILIYLNIDIVNHRIFNNWLDVINYYKDI